MPEFIAITDPDDPRLEDFRAIRERDLARRNGGFIAEGELVIRQITGSRFAPRSALVTTGLRTRLADVFAGWPAIPVFVAPEPVLSAAAGFHIHRGALACVHRGAELDAMALAGASRTLVVLEDLTNHDNIGGIFRNVAALGGPSAAVLLSPGCADPLYRKAIRVSMGHALRVPFARLESGIVRGLEDIARLGYTVIGLSPQAAGGWPDRASTEKTALVLGSEGPGLSAGALAACGRCLEIPMSPGVDSLNVATACAIALDRLARG